MWLAIDAVKKGQADVAVSAGNTGALMAMARFNLRHNYRIIRFMPQAYSITNDGQLLISAQIAEPERLQSHLRLTSKSDASKCYRRFPCSSPFFERKA